MNDKSTLVVGNNLDTFRQQAITWDNADQDLCLHLATLGYNKLTEYHERTVCCKHMPGLGYLFKLQSIYYSSLPTCQQLIVFYSG